MGDAENTPPPTKKRAAGKEISRDNPGIDDDEETSEQETGTFKKASDEVLAGRRFVKVCRPPTTSTPSANPFTGIELIPSAVSKSVTPEATSKIESGNKVSEAVDGNDKVKEEIDESNDHAKAKEIKADVQVKTEIVTKEETVSEANKSVVEGEKSEELEKAEAEGNEVIEGESTVNKDEEDNGNENADKTEETASFSSFQQLSSSQNAFTGLVGTGFSSSTFSFGFSKDGSSSCGSGFAFGQKSDQPSFGFNFANNNGSSLFSAEGGSAGPKGARVGFPSMQEVPVETGEENEKSVFTADSVLFEFLEGGWKERGKGELKVNVPTTGTRKARLVMRSKGHYRLILNASLYPDMKLANMDKKGITFACVNSVAEGKEGLSTFALKFKDVSFVEEFRSVVTDNKEKATAVLRTPENSPKASDEQ